MYRDIDRPDSPERPQRERTERQQNCNRADREPITADTRTVYELRDKSYRLNSSQARMLSDIGTFRTIDKPDLLKSIYRSDQDRFDRDLRHLHRQNLVRIVGPKGSPAKYIVLTKPARELTEKHLRTNARQTIYAGAAKPRELKHDAALYRLYSTAVRDILRKGGKPERIVLDYEFKRRINRELARTRQLPKDERKAHIRQVAEREKLKIVNGKIPIPDVRIEYETAEGDRSMCDLEYITQDYRAPAIAEKKAAGFQLYGENGRGRKVYGPDLMGEILSL